MSLNAQWQWVTSATHVATKVTLDQYECAAAMGGFHLGVAELVIATELTLDCCELKQFDGVFEKR